MDPTAAAAVIFGIVIVAVVAFQVALALGAPWGAYAMGGTFPGRYPPAMRVVAVAQAAFLVAVGAVVLARAGVVLPTLAPGLRWVIWVAVAVSAAAVVLNGITSSAGERRIWLPVAGVLLVSSLIVALTAT